MIWTERRLGDITENFDAVRVPVRAPDRRSGPYPYYGASGVIDRIDSFLFDGEYLLVAEDGENLQTRKTPIAFVARGRFWVNNHAHVVRGNGLADTRFLYYHLAAADISGYLSGSTQPKLTQASLARIPVCLPPIDEQRAIAGVVGVLDDKIELNRRMNETLEKLARLEFGATPRSASLPVGELVALARDTVDPGAEPEERFEHYSIPAYDDGQNPVIEPGSAIKSNKLAMPEGAILLSKLNPRISRVWLPDLRSGRRPVCSTEFLVALPNERASREFLYCLFRSAEFADDFGGRVAGTSGSHQRVKASDALSIEVGIPNPDDLTGLTAALRPLFDRIAANRRESRTLAELRDTLVPKLISGELRVRDVEQALS